MAKGIKKSVFKAKVKDLDDHVKDIAKQIKNIRSALDSMMNNANGPLWNGKKAQAFYKEGCKNVTNDIKDYNSAYKALEKLAMKYENIANRDGK